MNTEAAVARDRDAPALCADCGADTAPCTGKLGCRHAGRWEHYMATDAVWEQAGMSHGVLCIGCLEVRLGRHLRVADFKANVPINDRDP